MIEPNETTIKSSVMKFPAGIPKPHLARAWGRSLESATAANDLTDIARGTLPAGKFDKLWSDEAMAPPPPLPNNPTYKDLMSHRNMVVQLVTVVVVEA